MSAVGIIRIVADAIHTDDAGLILNRPRLQQPNPVLNPLLRPVCDHDKKFGPVRRRGLAKDFREAQVVTNERRDGAIAPAKNRRPLSRCVMLSLSTRREWLHLGVEGDQFSGGRKHQRFVACLAIASAHGGAGQKEDARFFCGARQELLGFPAAGLRHRTGVNGETGGKHFRQHDERIFFRARVGQPPANFVKIRRFVFPRDVELKGDNIHPRIIRGEAIMIKRKIKIKTLPNGVPLFAGTGRSFGVLNDRFQMRLVLFMKSSALISTLVIGFLLSAGAPMNLVAASSDGEFTKLADEFLAGYFAWRPLAGTIAGLHEYDGRITDYSRGSIERELARLQKFE